MKKVFILFAALAFSSSVFAGGFVTNTNQSTRFLRNPARNASTEIDAIYSNPAGLSFMKNDGFVISLNNQMAFQTRTITSTFAPFALNGGKETKEYKGAAQSFFIPSIQMAYKYKNWVISGSFAIVGGGGTLEYKNGLPMFEAMVAGPLFGHLTTLNNVAADPALVYKGNPLGYSLDMNLKGTNITYGAQLGVNYKIKDMFSVFLGARTSILQNGYKGYLRNVQITNADAMGTHFTQTAAYLESVGMLEQAAALKGAALGIAQLQVGVSEIDIKLNTKQNGWGIAPILGVGFEYENFNIGVKYEFKTSIETKNKTKVNTSGVADFDDGVKTDNDLPALLSTGMSYKFLNQKLIASTGFNMYFDKQSKMPNDKQELLKNNTMEVLLGLEYVINDRFLVSAGGQVTRFGLKDGFQSNMSFYCNSFSVGFGGACNIVKGLSLNLGYLYTHYEKYTNNNPVYKHPILGGKEVYNRTSHAVAIGLDYKF